MPHPAADRNLLFGILALQMDFIRRDDLVAAMHAWVLDKDRSLGQILCTQGVLSGERCTLLEALVQEHLKQHGDDTQRSLAAVSSLLSVRQDLQQLADADVQASLAHVAPAPQGVDPHATRDPAVDTPASPEVDPYATRTASVGAPTSSGVRFLILRPHARGGLGEVFVAHDEELHREVALKEIQAQHAHDPQSRSRFVLEAKVTGGLEHPGIVPVYGLGTYADGRPFYAMRFIRGDSLKDALERFHRAEGAGRDPGERALELRQLLGRFVDVCQAIAYAHSRGVLHRDLKPGNIMLGKYGETLVVDWELAKHLHLKEARTEVDEPTLHPASSGSLEQTMPGSVIGTPAYMSPEQAAGRLDLLGPASDVYSLGATLYSLLTGKPPFEEKDLGALLRKVQQGDFPPPRQVHRKTPAALEAICLKAMARKPQDRYPSPGALADDLEHWLADEPVAAYREPLSARLGRWARRHRTLVMATGALLGTAVVALTIGTVLLRREQQQTEGQRQQAEGERQQAVAALQREEQARKERALAQVDLLVGARPQAVPSILTGLEPYGDDVLPRLHELWDQEDRPDNHARRLRAGVALLPADVPGVKDQLYAEMLRAKDPGEMLLLCDALRPYRADFTATLWRKADDQRATAEERFRALVALAAFDDGNDRWRTAGDGVVAPFLSANPLHLGLWLEALRPVRLSLLDPLGRAFRDDKQPERRQVAATVLADYAGDRPEDLANLLCDADARQYAVLLPKLQAHGDRAVALLEQELARTPAPDWQDPLLDPSWKTPGADLVQRIEKAQGLVDERFALCQTLPLDQFEAIAEGLRRCGYRPVRLRPSNVGAEVRVAAVWTRDARAWQMARGRTAAEVREQDADCRQKGYQPEDVAGYLVQEEGGTAERYAALWVQPASKDDEARVYIGVPEDKDKADGWGPLQAAGLIPRTYQVVRGGDGVRRFSAVWGKTADNPGYLDSFGTDETDYLTRGGYKTQIDVSLSAAPPAQDTRQRFTEQLAQAKKTLQAKPNDVQALFQAGQAQYRLGRDPEALADLDAVVAKTTDPAFTGGYQYRALVHARLGDTEVALHDLEVFRQRNTQAGLNVAIPAIVSAYLGADVEGMAQLEEAVAASKGDSQVLYNAAEAAAQVAYIVRTYQTERLRAGLAFGAGLPGLALPGSVPPALPLPLAWLERQQAARADAYAERAVALLRQAVDSGYADYPTLQTDPNFDSIRQHPGFSAILSRGHLKRQYSAVWQDSAVRASAESHGLDPVQHLQRMRELAGQGWRPAAIAVAWLEQEGPPLTASVWQRPVVADAARDALARRQAQAAVALLRSGQAERVWPLFRHSPEPRLRSYLLDRVGSLDADAQAVVQRLETETEVSARRALILALGEYTGEQLPAAERARLVPRLLEWYRSDPDPGVHGALDWLLRHSREGPDPRKLDWGQAAALKRIDEELAAQARAALLARPVGLLAASPGSGALLAAPAPLPEMPGAASGERRWYVSPTGQTLTAFRGPVEFLMGSPGQESGRFKSEVQHRWRIGRNFAIATKPVTVAQFEEFDKAHPEVLHAYAKQYSPEPEGPIIMVTWYEAAAYCRWLSEQEGIPEEQMCYPPIADIEKSKKEGTPLKLPADLLSRTGYRLPTEAEWEYACRAGAVTARYYGSADDLLGRYAWYLDNNVAPNGQDRTWPVGQKRPNDYGLFDMHGEVWQWCQDAWDASPLGARGPPARDMGDNKDITDKDSRVLRGGPFTTRASHVRSASRLSDRPADRNLSVGLRVARTRH